ncbi:MAG: tyrosine--tRNA ligase [Candidatus Pacebacteria bacterium]|nr:tyrosine--tRNA ligase [Candidatus Paceibacterota bacterium]
MKKGADTEKIEELLARGAEDIIDKKHLKEALLSGKKLNIKFGIDPTGPKIHLGRATLLLKLKDFQDLGHKITLIIGNFTAQIGDASDKDSLRPPLTEDEVKNNMRDYLPQIGRILDLKKTDIKYNSEWLQKLCAKDLILLTMGFTAQQMIHRRNFKERWEAEKPIGVHELLYPILQGYDSVAVKADVELGGFDQLFNLKTGREIQRTFGQNPQDIMTLKMIYGLDGRKMSTSWGNVITILDDPKEMFGKLMSLKDGHIIDYFECCTRVPMKQVNAYKKELESKKTNPKEIKKILAKEIISNFYSAKEAEQAEKEFEKVFEKKDLPSQIKGIKIKEKELDILDLLILMDLAKSKGEARRLVEQGGVKIISGKGAKIISNWKEKIEIKKGLIIQSGKRNFRKIF